MHRLRIILIDTETEHNESCLISSDRATIAYAKSTAQYMDLETALEDIGDDETLYRLHIRHKEGFHNRFCLTASEVREILGTDWHAEDLRKTVNDVLSGIRESAEFAGAERSFTLERDRSEEIEDPPLLHAAKRVVDSWSGSDLARWVNALEEAIETST